MLLAALLLIGCHTLDGDTLKCGRERIRLLGIDAPEKPGHCRRGRVCAPGDPVASERSLRRAMRSGPLTVERVGTDPYGRTIALVRAGNVDLSCWQIGQGQAVYVRKWDNGARVRRRCG